MLLHTTKYIMIKHQNKLIKNHDVYIKTIGIFLMDVWIVFFLFFLFKKIILLESILLSLLTQNYSFVDIWGKCKKNE